nr:retrovirus-related Pol polyprotein from transposon TNT 1-94 [Tanacetum cinerariifolium]
MEAGEKATLMKKAYSTLILCLRDRVLREVTKETTVAGIWTKLTSLYMTKSLANILYLKKQLYTYYMSLGTKLGDRIDELNKLILDLTNIDIEIEDEDHALMLLTSSPFLQKLCGDIVVWEGILDNGGCSGDSEFKGVVKKNQRHKGTLVLVENDEKTELVMDSGGSYHMTHIRDFLYDFKVIDDEDAKYVPRLRKSLISLGTLEKEGYIVKMQMGRIKVIKGCRVMKTEIKKKNSVYSLEAKVDKRVWFEVELHGAQRNRETEVF